MANIKLEKGSIFERCESKYKLNAQQYHALRAALQEHMQTDAYGVHTICSLYYDTDDFAVIRHCLEKPTFREKLRLRSYGVPNANSTVYLELKKKLGKVTYKRRAPLLMSEVCSYLEHGVPLACKGQIYKEIDWYTHQNPISGKVVICYDRLAMSARDNAELRITFDANIRWRSEALSLAQGDYGSPLLPSDIYLMEIKMLGALPYWLATILSQCAIYPTSFSKYATIYNQFLCKQEVMKHVV